MNNPNPHEVYAKYRMLKRQIKFLDYLYLAKTFKRSKGRISHALSGQAPNLLIKIDRHLDLLKTKQKTIGG